MRWLKTSLLVVLLFSVNHGYPQGKATVAQQFYVMKMFKPDLKAVGVILSTARLGKLKKDMARAGLINGLKVVYADVGDLHELGEAFSTLTAHEEIGFLWIPPDDPIVSTGVAMQYVLKKAVLKGIATCVPNKKWLSSGATLFVGMEDGKIRPYFNTRLVEAMGMKVPEKYAALATAE